MANARNTGCLVIGDAFCEADGMNDLLKCLTEQGVRAEAFRISEQQSLYHDLQMAYQRVRRDDAPSAIAAWGAGCDCALAIAGQLPVDRVILISPRALQARGERSKPLARVRRYARRGMAFCVADALIVSFGEAGRAERELLEGLCNCRAVLAEFPREAWPKGKKDINLMVSRFLCAGVLPKSLAENSEMCIIYG